MQPPSPTTPSIISSKPPSIIFKTPNSKTPKAGGLPTIYESVGILTDENGDRITVKELRELMKKLDEFRKDKDGKKAKEKDASMEMEFNKYGGMVIRNIENIEDDGKPVYQNMEVCKRQCGCTKCKSEEYKKMEADVVQCIKDGTLLEQDQLYIDQLKDWFQICISSLSNIPRALMVILTILVIQLPSLVDIITPASFASNIGLILYNPTDSTQENTQQSLQQSTNNILPITDESNFYLVEEVCSTIHHLNISPTTKTIIWYFNNVQTRNGKRNHKWQKYQIKWIKFKIFKLLLQRTSQTPITAHQPRNIYGSCVYDQVYNNMDGSNVITD